MGNEPSSPPSPVYESWDQHRLGNRLQSSVRNSSNEEVPLSDVPPTRAELSKLSYDELLSRLRAYFDEEILKEVSNEENKENLVTLVHRALGGGSEKCAICFNEELAVYTMPCCGREDSDLRYCRRCLEIVFRDSSCCAERERLVRLEDGRRVSFDPHSGVCPSCRGEFILEHKSKSSLLQITNPAEISKQLFSAKLPPAKPCRRCNKSLCSLGIGEDDHTEDGLCRHCLIGDMYFFEYECYKCSKLQRIGHPLWMFQQRRCDFSERTWACGYCDMFTHWRISDGDVRRIPEKYRPESWD